MRLAYGKEGLAIEVPASAMVIEPRYLAGLADERAAIVEALRRPIESPPLRELVCAGQRVVVVHTDITRAPPAGPARRIL